VYVVVHDGRNQAIQKSVTAESTDEQVLSNPLRFEHLDDVAPDGKYLVGSVPVAGDDKPIQVAATTAEELYGRISPDGHWIAYSSESGISEIYIQAFPPAGTKVLVSRNRGTWAVWRRDGKELFYVSADSNLMAFMYPPIPT